MSSFASHIIKILKYILHSFACYNNQEIHASSLANCNIKINQVLFIPSCVATTKKISEFLDEKKHTKKKHVARLEVKWQKAHHYQNGEPQRVGFTKIWWYEGCNEIVDFEEHGLNDPTPISAPSLPTPTFSFSLPSSFLTSFIISSFFFVVFSFFFSSFFSFDSYFFVFFFLFFVMCGFVWSLCDMFVFLFLYFLNFYLLLFFNLIIFFIIKNCDLFVLFLVFFCFFVCVFWVLFVCVCATIEKEDMNNKKGRNDTKIKWKRWVFWSLPPPNPQW